MSSAAAELASIVVPCWNKLRYTKDCVASVLRRTRKPYELILVDNGSTDGTPAYLERLRKSHGAVVISNPRNLGFGPAINQGMERARGEYVIWLNNDAVVTPGWLDRLMSCARRHPKAGAVGPVVNDEWLGGRANADRLAAAMALGAKGRASPVPWLLGFCLLLKRRAMREVGLLDPRFGAGLYEDYDYCLRLRQAGWDVLIAKDAFVYHHWHKSFASRAELARRGAVNRELFIDKWCRFYLELMTFLPPAQSDGARFWTKPAAK